MHAVHARAAASLPWPAPATHHHAILVVLGHKLLHQALHPHEVAHRLLLPRRQLRVGGAAQALVGRVQAAGHEGGGARQRAAPAAVAAVGAVGHRPRHKLQLGGHLCKEIRW